MAGHSETRIWIEGVNLPHNMPGEPLGDGLLMPTRYTAKFDNPEWPLISIDISVSNRKLHMERVEFLRREGEPALGPSLLRTIPLTALMEFTIQVVGMRPDRQDNGQWVLTPVNPEHHADAYVDAIRSTRRRGPRLDPKVKADKAKEALRLYTEAKNDTTRKDPAIKAVSDAFNISRAAAYRLMKAGREAKEGKRGRTR